jgi:hypothetical protein
MYDTLRNVSKGYLDITMPYDHMALGITQAKALAEASLSCPACHLVAREY